MVTNLAYAAGSDAKLSMAKVMEYLVIILISVPLAAVALAAYALLIRRREERVERRLEQMVSSSTPELILGDLTPALAGQLPPGAEKQIELQQDLRTAGYYQPTALMEYAALRAVLIIAPLLAAGALPVCRRFHLDATDLGGGPHSGPSRLQSPAHSPLFPRPITQAQD